MIKGDLREDLENIRKEIVERDKDFVMVVSGQEGIGKSCCALNICKQFDPDFSVKDIVFTTKEFIQRVKESRPGKAILIDEGGIQFFSRDSMTTRVKNSVKLLTGCRKYNLLIVVCVPSFFILDKYIRDHRVGCLVNVYERGRFVVFGKEQVEQITKDNQGKQYYPDPYYSGTYTKLWGKLWKDYVEKKEAEMIKLDQEPEKKKEKARKMTKREEILLLLRTGKFDRKEIAELTKSQVGYVNQIAMEM